MSRNSVNKAVILIPDNYGNGIKLPEKSELNNIISDILQSFKNDIRTVNNIEEAENHFQNYIPILEKKYINTRRNRIYEMKKNRQEMELEKIIKENELQESQEAQESQESQESRENQQTEQEIKEEIYTKEIEMIMDEIKKRILAEQKQEHIMIAEDNSHEEENVILYVNANDEDEVYAAMKALIEEQLFSNEGQVDTTSQEDKTEYSFIESSTLTWVFVIILLLLILFILNKHFNIINL
jgi:hypothetical protein